MKQEWSPSIEFSRQEYWSGLPFPSPGDLPNPGIEPRSPALQADSLPSETPGKPNESESRSVLSDCLRPHGLVLQARILEWVAFSLLQQIFPTQESNWGLLHCRQILYQMSYQGSPKEKSAVQHVSSGWKDDEKPNTSVILKYLSRRYLLIM